jgi:hypothetical protein
VKHAKLSLIFAAAVLLLPCLAAYAQDEIVVGILPTYDSSGEENGGSVSQLLTSLLFQQFAQDPRFRPVFLNPGGFYDPTSTKYVAEYVQTLDSPVDVVLATTFMQPDAGKKGEELLRLKAAELDPTTGEELQTNIASTPIKDYKEMIDFGRDHLPTGFYSVGQVYQPSKAFDKSPMGKAATELARQTLASAAQMTSKVKPSGKPPQPDKVKECTMQLKINYVSKHAISKSYEVIINGKDESPGRQEKLKTEGVVEVPEPATRLMLQVKLMDTPYKLPKQDVYLFDPVLDCSRSSNFLNVNIGPAGEAVTVWR